MTMLRIVGISLFMIPAITLASPTPNEYLPCHRLAAATLQACLDHGHETANQDCWNESRQRNATCYREVKLSHSPVPHRERKAAEQKAAQEMRNKELTKKSE